MLSQHGNKLCQEMLTSVARTSVVPDHTSLQVEDLVVVVAGVELNPAHPASIASDTRLFVDRVSVPSCYRAAVTTRRTKVRTAGRSLFLRVRAQAQCRTGPLPT